jgi:low affinity Fe/Cu permease
MNPSPPPPAGPGPFERLTQAITRWLGTTVAFLIAGLLVTAWIASGLLLGFSDAWLWTINTTITVLMFLMLFLLQRSQNKDTLALQIKLNELVGAVKGASNRLIAVENLSEAEIERLHDHFQDLAVHAKKLDEPTHPVSVEQRLAEEAQKAPADDS